MRVTVVPETDGTFRIIDEYGATLRTGFASNADAWRCIDRALDSVAQEDEDRRRRIQTAFSER